MSVTTELNKFRKNELIDIIMTNKPPNGVNSVLLMNYLKRSQVRENSQESIAVGDLCANSYCVNLQMKLNNVRNELDTLKNYPTI